MGLCSLSVVCLRPNYGRGNSGNASLLQKDLCRHATPPRAVAVGVPGPVSTQVSAEDSRNSQASLAQSLLSHCSFLWVLVCTRFCCALQESFPPVLWKFCSQIPLAFKIKFPGGSQSLFWIPRLGNLLWALELLQQCENFFSIIVLQFVGCLLNSSMVGLMVTSSKRT